MTAPGRARRRAAPYAAPLYYHVAFELNRKAETDFLVACFRKYARGSVRHVLDVACGTGHHSLRLARRGYRMTALDLSAPSIAFLGAEAARLGLEVTTVAGDMTDFRLPEPVDAAICMQDSQGHLLETAALLAHLRAVRRNVRPGGLYIFDRLVPNGWSPGARWTWTRRRRGIIVRTTFQTLLDYDVARQVCQEVMRFDISEKGRTRVVVQRHPTRIVFPQELRALVELAGGWELCGWFSNFSLRRPLEKSAAALVMIAVLRARAGSGLDYHTLHRPTAGRGELYGSQGLTPLARLVLRPRREARIRGGHPWVYRADVARLDGAWRGDEAVTVCAADGRVLGRGFYNPRPQIVCRLLTRHDEPVDDAFLRRRLHAAWAFRGTLGYDGDAGRVVFGEGDALPGLVVDRYGDVLALQALTRGIAARAGRLAELAAEVTGTRAVYRRGDPTAAAIEGFDDLSGWLVGRAETVIEIREGPCRFHVDLEGGQKTGFYLDQRENRAEVGARAAGRVVLDAFAYTGAFAAWALRSGATSVLALDSSGAACARAAAHLAANAPPGSPTRHEVLEANAFDTLRAFERDGRRFDLIVLDPPPFTRRRTSVDAALRGYKEITLRAFRCLRAGGLLATFSCSHHVSPALFEEVCRAAAEDVGRPVRVAAPVSQARDHPVLLAVPETRYLTGLVLEMLE